MLTWIVAGDPLPDVSTYGSLTFSGSFLRAASHSTTNAAGGSSSTWTSHETNSYAGSGLTQEGSSTTSISSSGSTEYRGTSSSSRGETVEAAHASQTDTASASFEEYSSSSYRYSNEITYDGTNFSAVTHATEVNYYSFSEKNAQGLTSQSDPGGGRALITGVATFSASASTVISLETTSSTSASGTNETTPFFETTVMSEDTRFLATWATSTGSGSVWTTRSTTTTTASGTDTGTTSSIWLTSGSSTRTLHVSDTTTTSSSDGEEDGGTFTARTPLLTSATYSTAVLTVTDDLTLGLAINTVMEAGPCLVLYTAGPVEGVKVFCDLYESVDRVIVEPAFDSSSGSSTALYTFSSSTDITSDESTLSQQDFSSFFGSTLGFVQSSFSDHSGPVQILGGSTLLIPMMGSGFQPYTALGLGDPLHAGYSISIPTSVTEVDAIFSRKKGLTFLRYPSVTQVVPISSEDSLAMLGGAGSGSTFTLERAGGFGGAGGVNSLTLYQGVFRISRYTPDGSSSITSASTEMTVSSSTAQVIPRGELWAIETLSAYSSGDVWFHGGSVRMAVTELACDANALVLE